MKQVKFQLARVGNLLARAAVVAKGAGGTATTLLCGTNLVAWSTALSGAYTNQPAAKFFRIRLDRIQP